MSATAAVTKVEELTRKAIQEKKVKNDNDACHFLIDTIPGVVKEYVGGHDVEQIILQYLIYGKVWGKLSAMFAENVAA